MKHYSCTSCRFEQFIGDYDPIPVICPDCSSKSCRVVYNVYPKNKSEFVNICYDENERWSWALGCNENQLAEKMKKHPGAEFRKAPGGGYQMRISGRPEKIQRMKEANYEEYG